MASVLGKPRFNPMRARELKGKIAVAAVLFGWAAACSDAALTPGPGGETRTGSDPSKEAGASETGSSDEDGGASIKPSGCPAPDTVSPDSLPSGFLEAQTVTLVRTVDGDTAHFTFPGKGETIVRFLYVNTEETHDTEATQFGVNAAYQVGKWLEGASEIRVAPEEDKKKPGQPHLDTYGRTLALVFVDGDLFQTRMIRDGWTPYYTQFGCAAEPVHDALLFAEAEAKANARGVWEDGHPTDYTIVMKQWIGSNTCRPNPYKQPYCNK